MGKRIARFTTYIVGLALLALGLSLNVKTGRGASAIVSVSYALSLASGVGFGDTTLLLYALFVVIELIVLGAFRKLDGKRAVSTVLQLPLSLVFTRVMDLVGILVPDVSAGPMHLRLVVLLLAIAFTGVGAALSLDMRIVPNPGDGIVQAFSDVSGKTTGLVKNLFDLVNIIIAIALSLALTGRVESVGLGTLAAVILVGRVIAVVNKLFGRRLGHLVSP